MNRTEIFVSRNATFWGMIKYDILGDGCLNGVWTNSLQENGKIFNEIARKKRGRNNQLEGEYFCSWLDQDEQIRGTLTIERSGNCFLLEWTIDDERYFRGVGMQIDNASLIVTFWDGDSIEFPGAMD